MAEPPRSITAKASATGAIALPRKLTEEPASSQRNAGCASGEPIVSSGAVPGRVSDVVMAPKILR